MTVVTVDNRIQYNGNGATTTFSFPYKFYQSSDIIVTLTDVSTNVDTVQTTPSQYSISGTNIVFVTPPTVGIRVTIDRQIPYTQTSNYVDNQAFQADVVEENLDRSVIMSQQIKSVSDRSLKYPSTISGITSANLPVPVNGKTIIFDGVTGDMAIGPDATDIANAQPSAASAVAAAAEAALSAASAAASAAGMKLKSPARAATTGALPSCTYANGSSGVGATLTATANGALPAQDGVILLNGEALLVKDQVSAQHNGIYVVTQIGTAGSPFILTRQVDSDTWSEIFSALVVVSEGFTLGDTEFLCTSNNGGTMGTTAITWQQRNTIVADGSVTFAKIASAAIATSAEIISGTVSKLVSSSILKAAYPRMIIDSSYTEYTTNADISTAIPLHDTSPASGEGTQILSVAITPKTTTNRLRIRFHAGTVSCNASVGYVIAALFTGGATAAAAMAVRNTVNDNPSIPLYLEHEYVPGVTTLQTITVRVGPNSGTIRLNGTTSGRYFGGASRATLIVEEITA